MTEFGDLTMSASRKRRFADFEFDAQWGRLYRQGRAVKIQPQPLRVLALLLERAGDIVSRDELKARVWDGSTFVEFDQGLNYCIRQIRLALDEDPSKPRYLETVKGMGYRFIAPVHHPDDLAANEGSHSADLVSGSAWAWPAVVDPLLGRENDLARVEQMLAEHSLVTLTGPGGVGKTRLALEIGRRREAAIEGTAYWIDLTRATRSDDVLPLVAAVLGNADTGTRPLLQYVQDSLRQRRVLLIFDNFEHVLPAAPLLPELCAPGAKVRVLATSRASLSVRGEHEYRVPPLPWSVDAVAASAGAAQPPAVRLFFDRVQARAGTDADVVSARDAAALCERLDGLPLAIELAAARVSVMAVGELLTRDRIVPLLPESPRDVPVRQQSLRRTLQWSYDLLGPREQAALRALAVFIGSFTTEAAIHVLMAIGVAADEGAALDALSTLRQHSLLATESATAASVRLRLLQTVREFSLDVSAADERARAEAAHATWVRQLFEREAPRIRTSQDVAAMERLFADEANLRAALRYLAHSGSTHALVILATAASWFWHTANLFAEGCQWIFRAIDAARDSRDVPEDARCAACATGSLLAFHVGAFDQTARLIREVAAAPADPFAVTLAECLRGAALAYDGRLETAASVAKDARDRARALNDRWLEGFAELIAAHCESLAGQHLLAHERLRAAPRGLGFLDVWLEITVAFEAVVLDRIDDAVRGSHAVLSQRYGSYRPIRQLAGAFEVIGYVCERRGNYEDAGVLLAAADRWRRETAPLGKVWLAEHDRAVGSVRQALGDRFDDAWARGQSLTLEQALALAAALTQPNQPISQGRPDRSV